MGKYLSEKERYAIENMLKAGIKKGEIARILERDRKTIYNEIKRGTVKQLDSELREYYIYKADRGEQVKQKNQSNKGRPLKIGNDLKLIKHIEHMKNDMKYSPYAILADIKNRKLNFKTELSEKTIYNYINTGIFLNIEPNKRIKKQENKRKVALNNTQAKSIEERPKEVNKRNTYGHWEMDTVVSGQKKGKACLLVLTERSTLEEIIIKLENKKAESTVKALNRLERKIGAVNFREKFKTITVDNGVEFLDTAGMEKSIYNRTIKRTELYYCHPFASGERGQNENQNRLIRRFIPKGTNIEEISDRKIKELENWMNNYPRRKYNGKSANMIKNEAIA